MFALWIRQWINVSGFIVRYQVETMMMATYYHQLETMMMETTILLNNVRFTAWSLCLGQKVAIHN